MRSWRRRKREGLAKQGGASAEEEKVEDKYGEARIRETVPQKCVGERLGWRRYLIKEERKDEGNEEE